jgi:2-aminoethylphosphonate transport system substrate-binding protein
VTANSQWPEQAKRLLAYLLSEESQKAVAPEAFGIPARDSVAREMVREANPLTPGRLLDGVQLWTPDWNSVLYELEDDVAAYQKAIDR